MKKIFVLFTFSVIILTSCKTKQAVASAAEGVAENDKETKEIIAGHYNNPHDFKTLMIRSDVSYKDDKLDQDVSAEIRILKDQKILVIVKYSILTVAKALVTPDEVTYYESIGRTYFRGDYKVLSRWLGTELDYNKVQNLLIGEALYDLNKGAYKASIENGQYKLSGKDSNIIKQFLFEGANYLLKKQVISQSGTQPRTLEIDYPSHQVYAKATLPSGIKIEAEQQKRVTINIAYSSVKFDENLTYPYNVPEGYEQIFVD